MAVSPNTRYDRDAARAAREKAASGLSGSYAQRAAANPYGNSEFSPNTWQHLGELIFGDYSARDSFYQQQDQAAMEYINQLLDAQHQERYNSPEAQAARERAAGLNPNLTGVGTGEQPAASAPPDDTPPEGMNTSGSSMAEPIANAIFPAVMSFMDPTGFLSAGTSLAMTASQLKTQSNQREMNELTTLLTALEKIPGIAAGLAPTEAAVVDDSGTVRLDAAKMDAAWSKLGLSKGTTSRLKALAGMTSYDANGNTSTAFQEAYRKLRASSLEQGQKIVDKVSSPGYSENLAEWSTGYYERVGKYQQECMGILAEAERQKAKLMLKLFSDDFNEARADAELAGLGAQEEAANYQRNFLSNLDPQVAANAEKQEQFARAAEAIARSAAAKINAATEKRFSDEISEIQNNSNLSKEVKRDLINGVLIRRTEWYNERLADQVKAGKTVGGTDWLNAGSSLLNTATGAFIGKVPTMQAPAPTNPYFNSTVTPYGP